LKQQQDYIADIESQLEEAQTRFEEKVAAVEKRDDLSPMAKRQKEEEVRLHEQTRLEADIKSIESQRSKKLKQMRFEMEQEVRGVQDRYKLYAILIPPIPPLLVALYVFFQRRNAEREGIAKSRLR
jgi:ABC-2 type transport system permease protein